MLAASSSIGWQYLQLCVQFCDPDDGRRDRLKHAEHLLEINKSRNIASCWLQLRNGEGENVFFFFSLSSGTCWSLEVLKTMKWKQLSPYLHSDCTIFITPHKEFLMKSHHMIFIQNNFIGQSMQPSKHSNRYDTLPFIIQSAMNNTCT